VGGGVKGTITLGSVAGEGVGVGGERIAGVLLIGAAARKFVFLVTLLGAEVLFVVALRIGDFFGLGADFFGVDFDLIFSDFSGLYFGGDFLALFGDGVLVKDLRDTLCLFPKVKGKWSASIVAPPDRK